MKKIILLLVVFISFFGLVSASCYTDYGVYARDNYNWTCSCIQWYHFENKYWLWTQCVKDPSCYELYGFWAKDNYNWTCSCRDWYVWWTDFLWNKKCVDADQSCRDQYWYWAEDAWWWYCKCSSSYTWSTDILGNKECVTCTIKYWIYAKYNFLTSSCECKDWYTLGDNGKCVEKQNNVYFFLKELDNNEAIIYNNYNKLTYLISYWAWCISMRKYENKLIVINLWTDFTLDTRDTIVLPDDDQTCSITSKELVDDTYTLKSCTDIYWDNSIEVWDDKCSCKAGYMWNSSKTQCVEWRTSSITSTYNTSSYNTPSDNTELTEAILWMYNNWLTSYNTIDKFMWNDYLTREQASKIFVKFANTLWKYDDVHINNQFTDIKNADPTLLVYIWNAYSMWIIKWVDNRFMPFNKLTRAQAIAIIIRISNWLQNENGIQWYSVYYNIANGDLILSGLWFNYSTLDSVNIKRSEVALLLYRLNNYLNETNWE